jgi:plastocyanin
MNKKENPQHHVVKIKVENGDFTYNPQGLMVYRNDTVEWICDEGHAFAVHLGWNSPFEKCRYRAKKGQSVGPEKIRDDAPWDRYEYFVSVLETDEKIQTDDPELIVKRPGR